jgi:hypothetical protein
MPLDRTEFASQTSLRLEDIMTTGFDGRRKQISEAAHAYTGNAWHSSWPLPTVTLSPGAWLGMLSATALAVTRAGQQGA